MKLELIKDEKIKTDDKTQTSNYDANISNNEK